MDKFKTQIDKNQLNLVLQLSQTQTQTIALNLVGSGTANWLFLFNNRQNVSESFLASHLSEYFKSYYKIGLDSGIYILIYSENNAFLFEVYRKMPNSNITVSLLCKLNQISNNVEKFLGKNVLVRRRDLTGVHLKIGYLTNMSFFYEENEASKSNFMFHMRTLKI